MRELVADRFVSTGRSWTDLASGGRVSLRFAPSASRADEIVWNDQRAERARLRHPLLNVLVDYGAASGTHLFEAYDIAAPIPAAGSRATDLLQHAARFLASRGLPVEPRSSRLALREVTSAAPEPPGRPIGVVLQPRPVLDGLAEVFERGNGPRASGPLGIEIAGGAGSGIRTTRLLASRLARLGGYVPVASTVLVRWPSLRPHLLGRHLCVLLDDHPQEERDLLATFLAELGARSARRHLLLRFTRTETPRRGARHIDSMGIAAMTAMVFVDGERGPSPEELFDAARGAAGRPGLFLGKLRASVGDAGASPPLVHESSPAYVVDAARTHDKAPPASRILRDAPERAGRLTARGRHASAERLLRRATRILEGRQDYRLAAACASGLGWLTRDRGRSDRAIEAFERARDLAGRAPSGAEAQSIGAAIGIGVVRTDQLRLGEAESALRGACAAAGIAEDASLAGRASLALARCLLWQSRPEEASLALATVAAMAAGEGLAAEAAALGARIRAAAGDARATMTAASDAVSRASQIDDARVTFAAFRSLAIAHQRFGDPGHARAAASRALRAAVAGHLPIRALTARCLLLDTAGVPGDRPSGVADIDRCRIHLRLALRRGALPAIVRREIEGVLSRGLEPDRQAAASNPSDRALEALESLLELALAAPDERQALDALCAHALEGVRAASVQIVAGPPSFRVLARAGRAWPVDPALVTRAVSWPLRGSMVRERAFDPDGMAEPRHAAEPVRYRSDALAVVCCRWAIGTEFDGQHAAGVLRATALAASSPVRMLLEQPEAPSPVAGFADLLGASDAAVALRAAIARAARSPFPVLVEGESGSGKELVARGIHRLGGRRDRRLCTLNCAALSDEMVEAELFGHARGAFTGAVGERPGLFEDADGGTIFLDEIGELSPRAQAKLLRVLQDGEVKRVGENLPRRVDARVVAATNRRLDDEVKAGRFRADLRFRLDVVRIVVPPLRERATDIAALAAHFWSEAAARVGTTAKLAPDVLAMLARYDWPGNVRELQNVIASLAVHAPRRGRIVPAMLPVHIATTAASTATTFEEARDEFERRFVRAALAQAGGRRARAAQSLGVSRQGLAKMMRRLRISDSPGGG
jgi:DNA-binding NtrC family response regulator